MLRFSGTGPGPGRPGPGPAAQHLHVGGGHPAAYKGGVGKTTLALELAYLLNTAATSVTDRPASVSATTARLRMPVSATSKSQTTDRPTLTTHRPSQTTRRSTAGAARPARASRPTRPALPPPEAP
jgi:hypothetical protein